MPAKLPMPGWIFLVGNDTERDLMGGGLVQASSRHSISPIFHIGARQNLCRVKMRRKDKSEQPQNTTCNATAQINSVSDQVEKILAPTYSD